MVQPVMKNNFQFRPTIKKSGYIRLGHEPILSKEISAHELVLSSLRVCYFNYDSNEQCNQKSY